MNIQKWLDGPYDLETKQEIRDLIERDPNALNDAFYRDLAFGTGGMRGIMGVGTNRINLYTIRTATQGLANYLKKTGGKRVFIGYDVRHRSRLFAEETARTLAGNKIEALLAADVCPTPLASFGCRHFGCDAAIMITASHNPPEYNGYKVYGRDGAQIVSPEDQDIIQEVRRIQCPTAIQLAPFDDPLIRSIGHELDDAYLQALATLQSDKGKKNVSIFYTNLHGTGLRIIPRALISWGFPPPTLIEEQMSLDGSFPKAPSPNPEEESALALGTKELVERQGDLLLATDPDADRIGLVVRTQNQAIRFNGNEIASICLAHLIERGPVSNQSVVIKTVVTTELLQKMAQKASIQCQDVLTGFKYIAEEIRKWEETGAPRQFLFGAEESHGYLFGTFARDKDAINASCLIAEAAQAQKAKGRTLVDALHDLYRTHGVHRQSLTTLAFADSASGMESMKHLMNTLRTAPPQTIGSATVLSFEDLMEGKRLPVSDVLIFILQNQTKLVIRPSGTEPKIKIYLETSNPAHIRLEESIAACDARLKETLHHFRTEHGL